MLVIILLGINLKYSILCTFSWFLVKLLLLIKTAQLTLRGSLNRPPPRFSPQEPPRARFISQSTMSPLTRASLVCLIPYLCHQKLTRHLKLLLSSHAKQPLETCAAGLERGGEGRKRERGLGREGKGLARPFLFTRFSPSPPLLSLRLFCACRAIFKTSSKKLKCLEPY